MDAPPQALRDELLRRYVAGERIFRGEDFEAVALNLRGQNLSAADFSEAFIVADFRDANLAGCCFNGANVKTCDFRGANLLGASFRGAAIDGAEFDANGVAVSNFEGASNQGLTYKQDEKPYVA